MSVCLLVFMAVKVNAAYMRPTGADLGTLEFDTFLFFSFLGSLVKTADCPHFSHVKQVQCSYQISPNSSPHSRLFLCDVS